MNIVEPIFVQCRNKPGDLALAAPGADLSMMSYGRLRRSVDNFCTKVLSLDLLPGQKVAVFIQEPILHCVALIALARLGIVTVSGRKKDFSCGFPSTPSFPIVLIILPYRELSLSIRVGSPVILPRLTKRRSTGGRLPRSAALCSPPARPARRRELLSPIA